MKTNQTTFEQKKVTITEFGVKTLGEHALSLDPQDPARIYITMLLRRWHAAPAIAPALEPLAAVA